MTIQTRVAAGRDRLREARISATECTLDARLLAQHALGWTTERYMVEANQPEPDGFVLRYDALLARRAAREPYAYIVGRREFWGLEFEVTPAVLIPRPSTELLVEAVLEHIADPSAPAHIADACTGCGCVAISVAHDRPQADVVATDISETALDVARRNASRLGVAGRVVFMRTDLLEGLEGPFDAIVANPPYVLENAGPALQPEVRDHEPGIALYGGGDGLRLIARLVAQAPRLVRVGGLFAFEFGYGQDVEIEALIAASPDFALIELKRDIQGIARTAVTRRM